MHKAGGRLTVTYREAARFGFRRFQSPFKFDTHLDNSVAEVPVEFQSDKITKTSNLAAPRLQEILH